MKKAMISLLMIMVLLLVGCGGSEDRVAALEEQVSLLREQVQVLQERVDTLEEQKVMPEVESIGSVTADREGSAELRLDDWYAEEGTLTVDLFVRIDTQDPDVVPEVQLLLYLGEAVTSVDVAVEPGEAAGSYVAQLHRVSFDIAALAPGQELELELVARFPDGGQLQAGGIGWYEEDGILYQISG